jgi:CRP-like cAMP-binding protein
LRELLPSLEAVSLPLGMVVYESGGPQGYVYFPTSSIVSLLYVLADGSSAEIAVTGNEGLVGIALFMGGETTRAARWCRAPAAATGCAPRC